MKPISKKETSSNAFTVVKDFGLAVKDSAQKIIQNITPLMAISVGFVTLLSMTAVALNGPHQPHIALAKAYAAWYAKWFALGVLSSVGLGVGTFLLFLGPFVAKTTMTANACRSVDFPVFGQKAFTCTTRDSSMYSLPAVLNKVKFEVFVWGVGCAFGYLPAFLLSKYAGQRQAAPFLQKLNRLYGVLGPLGFFYFAAVHFGFLFLQYNLTTKQ